MVEVYNEAIMVKSAVTAHNLSVVADRHTTILNNVSFSLVPGSVTGFIGPSGAGKTTLMRCIVGRQRLSAGNLTIFGLPAGSATLRDQVSYMTQQLSVYPDLTVQENLSYFATMVGIPRSQQVAATKEIIATVHLNDHANQLVGSLSGGQKQRVSLAIALIGNPKLMVLDEPTVGLDPVLREDLWRLFYQLASQGVALIISSHAMEEAERCNHLLLIRDGAILAQGSPQELRQRTGSQTIEQSFLHLVREPV